MAKMFTCLRCGFESKYKHCVVNHLSRKNPCQATLNDISREILIQNLNDKEYNEKTYDCEHCGKKFNSRSNKSRHKLTCKDKDKSQEMQKLKEIVDALVDKNKQLEDKIDSISNGSTIITNTNNGVINNNTNISVNMKNFGAENMNALPQSLVADLFLELQFKELLENLHCDPNYPENQNIRIKSIKRNVMEIYRNDKWDLVTFVNGLNELLLQGHKIFMEYYRNNKQKILEDDMTESELRETLLQLDKIEQLNKEDIKPFHEDLKLMLEANKDMNKQITS